MSGPKPTHIVEKFWPKVDKRGPDECWPWLASCVKGGYGKLREPGRQGRTLGAHVVSLMLATGEVADGRQALHSCDNKLCVNPAHLRWGTQSDNMQDAVARGRHFTPFRRTA